jgi:hypothetical protein
VIVGNVEAADAFNRVPDTPPQRDLNVRVGVAVVEYCPSTVSLKFLPSWK